MSYARNGYGAHGSQKRMSAAGAIRSRRTLSRSGPPAVVADPRYWVVGAPFPGGEKLVYKSASIADAITRAQMEMSNPQWTVLYVMDCPFGSCDEANEQDVVCVMYRPTILSPWRPWPGYPTCTDARSVASRVLNGYGDDTADIRKSFNASKVWSQAQLGGSIGKIIAQSNLMNCPTSPQTPDCIANRAEQGRANYAGGQAADQIRRALVELGYADDLVTGVAWGGADRAAWEEFTSDQSLPAGPGLVNKVGIDRLGELLRSGEAPGPTKAGMGKMGWLMVAGAVAIGAVALMAKGKRNRSQGMLLK